MCSCGDLEMKPIFWHWATGRMWEYMMAFEKELLHKWWLSGCCYFFSVWEMHLVAPSGQSHAHMICVVESPNRHSTSLILSIFLSSLKNLRIRSIYAVFIQHVVNWSPWKCIFQNILESTYTVFIQHVVNWSPWKCIFQNILESTIQWAGYVFYIHVWLEYVLQQQMRRQYWKYSNYKEKNAYLRCHQHTYFYRGANMWWPD